MVRSSSKTLGAVSPPRIWGKENLSRFMKKKDVEDNLFPNYILKRIALNFVLAGRVALSSFFWLVMNNPCVEKKVINEMSIVLMETRGEDDESKSHWFLMKLIDSFM